jgi:hypothetical protein
MPRAERWLIALAAVTLAVLALEFAYSLVATLLGRP